MSIAARSIPLLPIAGLRFPWLRVISTGKSPGVRLLFSREINKAIHGMSVFEILEEKPLGGSILHLLLSDLCQNFIGPQGEGPLTLAMDLEDRLVNEGVLPSDFCF
jgi:hypothetical protein